MSSSPAIHPLAARRILRMTLGTVLGLVFSQAFIWPLSFVTPVLTMFILALPLPVPTMRKGLLFILALLGPMIAAMLLLPFLQHARWVGILLVILALYYSFYYTAKGGSAVLGTFMTVGLTLTITIGSINQDILSMLIKSLAMSAMFALCFVWLAHALLPEPPPDSAASTKSPPPVLKPNLVDARRDAYRSMVIVLPLALLFMFMSGSPAYTVVMIKVAAMGQQASSDHSRKMGRSLMESTIWGGVGAIVAWYLMSAWPSLMFYSLLIGLAGLLYGRGIFSWKAVHPKSSMWSYAFLTMMVLLAPAVLDSGDSAGAAFWSRLILFAFIAIYGTAAVAVFDAFWPKQASKD